MSVPVQAHCPLTEQLSPLEMVPVGAGTFVPWVEVGLVVRVLRVRRVLTDVVGLEVAAVVVVVTVGRTEVVTVVVGLTVVDLTVVVVEVEITVVRVVVVVTRVVVVLGGGGGGSASQVV